LVTEEKISDSKSKMLELAGKIGRGEYFEALDFISWLRVSVISPLFQLKGGRLPRGLRKVEFNFAN